MVFAAGPKQAVFLENVPLPTFPFPGPPGPIGPSTVATGAERSSAWRPFAVPPSRATIAFPTMWPINSGTDRTGTRKHTRHRNTHSESPGAPCHTLRNENGTTKRAVPPRQSHVSASSVNAASATARYTMLGGGGA